MYSLLQHRLESTEVSQTGLQCWGSRALLSLLGSYLFPVWSWDAHRDLTLSMEVTVFPPNHLRSKKYTQVLCGGRIAVSLQDRRICRFADLRILPAFDFCHLSLTRSRLCLIRCLALVRCLAFIPT